MNIPNRHISIDAFHVTWNKRNWSIILKRDILSIDIIEEGRSEKGSINGSINLSLISRGKGWYLESGKLWSPNGFILHFYVIKGFISCFLVQVYLSIFYADIGNTNGNLEVAGISLYNSACIYSFRLSHARINSCIVKKRDLFYTVRSPF